MTDEQNIFSRVAARDPAAARVLALAFQEVHVSGRPDHVISEQLWAAVRIARRLTNVDASPFLYGRIFAPYFAGDPHGLTHDDARAIARQAWAYLDTAGA